VAWNVCRRVREHGVLLRPLGDVLVIMPPLTMTVAELRQVVDAVTAEISAIQA
jgi:adenosylmethionine-8-amino-7-oxononanoate aminotransferase